MRTLKSLERIGYKGFLVYDNLGNLMGRYSLCGLSPFQNLLFCQLTGGNLYYFDILVMKDEDVCEFFTVFVVMIQRGHCDPASTFDPKTEVDYFVDKMSNKSLQRTAIAAAELRS